MFIISPQEHVVTFVWVSPQWGITLFVGIWQDHLASLQTILLQCCELRLRIQIQGTHQIRIQSRSGTLQLSSDLGAGYSDEATLAAVYSNGA
jgi:hypothetical protein